MKFITAFKTLLLALLAIPLVCPRAESADKQMTDTIELVRATYQADRQALVTETLQLSDSEGAAFWPLYRSYRTDIEQIADGLVKVVLEYSDVYPNVPEDRARQLLKGYTALEEKLAKKRAWYFRRASKVLPAVKAFRWAQLENRMDLALRLQLAGTIPVVPDAPARQ